MHGLIDKSVGGDCTYDRFIHINVKEIIFLQIVFLYSAHKLQKHSFQKTKSLKKSIEFCINSLNANALVREQLIFILFSQNI